MSGKPLPGGAQASAHGAASEEPFHVTDEQVDLSTTPLEGWAALGLFWLLGVTVLYQFVTRYLFNDSAAWTEEIARYLLVGTVFVGAAIGVIKDTHIQVDFIYRYLSPRVGRAVSLAVDTLRVAFFACMVVLMAQMMTKLGDYEMTIVHVPMNVVYGVCEFGLAAMTWRSVQVLREHLRAPARDAAHGLRAGGAAATDPAGQDT